MSSKRRRWATAWCLQASATATPVASGALAIASLLSVQAVIALLRQRTAVNKIVDNEPLLLMRDGEFIPDALSRSRVTEADVIAKLREANVLRISDVRAVVLETTGDISVLHGTDELDDIILQSVRDIRGTEP